MEYILPGRSNRRRKMGALLTTLLLVLAGCRNKNTPGPAPSQPATMAFSLPLEWTATNSPSPPPTQTPWVTPTSSPSQTTTPRPTRDPSCSPQEQFAYIGNDGNVYLYDLCQGTDERLTEEGSPPWYFVDESEKTWNGDRLLLGRDGSIYVMDIGTLEISQLESDNNIDALWSPSGKWIAMGNYYEERITIVHSADYQEQMNLEGVVWDWLSDDELFFLTPGDNYQGVEYRQSLWVYDLLSETSSSLEISLERWWGPASFGRLSTDKRFFAYYGGSIEGGTTVGIIDLISNDRYGLERYEVVGYLTGGVPSYSGFTWSPTGPVLAICATPVLMDDRDWEFKPHGLYLDTYHTRDQITEECLGTPAWSPSGAFVSVLEYNFYEREAEHNNFIIATRDGLIIKRFNLFTFLQYAEDIDSLATFGPAWSFDEEYFSIQIEGKIFLTTTDWSEAEMQFLLEGKDLRWRY